MCVFFVYFISLFTFTEGQWLTVYFYCNCNFRSENFCIICIKIRAPLAISSRFAANERTQIIANGLLFSTFLNNFAGRNVSYTSIVFLNVSTIRHLPASPGFLVLEVLIRQFLSPIAGVFDGSGSICIIASVVCFLSFFLFFCLFSFVLKICNSLIKIRLV